MAGVSPVGSADGAFGVEDFLGFCLAEAPFVLAQVAVISRIDDGEAALGQGDAAEGVPVAHTAA